MDRIEELMRNARPDVAVPERLPGSPAARPATPSQSTTVCGACYTEPVPYTVLDYAEVDLPYNPQVPDSVTPRFAFRAMEDAGGSIATYGLSSTAGGQDGKACLICNLVNGTSASPIYMFASAVQMGPGNSPQQGVLRFAGLDAARAYLKTAAYADGKRMITSLRISD
jgi:hypothetical protein